MNKTTRRDLYREVTAQVLALMETHGADWTRPWASSGIPTNARTRAEYRGMNVLFLGAATFAHGYERNLWATLHQWNTLGAQVRKGEHGTLGVFWKPLTRTEVTEAGEEAERTYPVLRSFWLFNAAQVEGWEPPAEEGTGEAEPIERAEAFVAQTGADITHGAAGAFYVPAKDRISVPRRETFRATGTSTATEAYYGTVLHELTHWTGAKQRLARDLGGRFGSERYAAEELVAELGAAFLCAHLAISPTPRADHAKYLNNWMRTLKDDKRAFSVAAGHAQRAADYQRGLQPAEAAMDEAA